MTQDQTQARIAEAIALLAEFECHYSGDGAARARAILEDLTTNAQPEDSVVPAPVPDSGEPHDSRELLGRWVRQVWVRWASEQDDPKPSWLLGWVELDDGQREVDMRIGEALFEAGRAFAVSGRPSPAVGGDQTTETDSRDLTNPPPTELWIGKERGRWLIRAAHGRSRASRSSNLSSCHRWNPSSVSASRRHRRRTSMPEPANPDWDRYLAAAHAMQSGVAAKMNIHPSETEPKSLRVGVNAAMCDQAALARLLMAKGVITEDEYYAAIADEMEAERDRYQAYLEAHLGRGVTLV